MADEQDIFDYVLRQQVYLERLASGIIANYDSVDIALRRRIREVMAKLEKDSLGELTRKELFRLMAELEEAHLGVTVQYTADVMRELKPIGALAAGMEAAALANLLVNPPRFNMPTARLAYEAALAAPVQATGELLEPFVKDWPALSVKQMNNAVRNGWAQGRSVVEMTRDLVGTKKAGYNPSFADKSKRDIGSVVHTATMHVANTGRLDFMERNGELIVGYKFVATLDARTTQVCRSLDGRLFKPGEGPVPPLHIRCRSALRPELNPAFKFLKEGATRASSGPNGGPVDGTLTYYDWLKTQPLNFQRDAIGPTRAKLLRDGGLTSKEFAALNLSTSFAPLTLAAMREKAPEAFKLAGL